MLTYADEQAEKARLKAERAWRKTMREAKVYQYAKGPVYTPSVAADKVIEKLSVFAMDMIATARRKIDGFKERLANEMARGNPASAVEWNGGQLYVASADISTAESVLVAINDMWQHGDEYSSPSSCQVVEYVHANLYQKVLHASRYPSHSSSQSANLIEQAKARAAAELLERLDSLRGWFRVSN